MQREIELKLRVAPDDMSRLKSCSAITDRSIGVETKKKLRSVYFDTPDFDLKARKLALRVRHDGPRKIQTVKSESRSGLVSDRAECEVELWSDRPNIDLVTDRAMRRQITKATSRHGLKPQFETDINRTIRMLKTPNGGSIELAIDEGFIAADGLNELVSEIELELKEGDVSALYDVVRDLGEGVHLTPMIMSKADRGFALASGEKMGPSRGKPIKLDRNATIEEALLTILDECSRHLLANEPLVVEMQDAEGLHQMRVALRRLRAGIAILERISRDETSLMLKEEAKWLGECLGSARDADVFAMEVFEPVAQAFPEEGAMPHMREAIDRLRHEAWGDAMSALESKRYSDFILELGSAMDRRAWRQSNDKAQSARLAEPARVVAAKLLTKQMAKAAKMGRRIADLSIEERHTLRKQLKKFRYTGEFFASLFKKKKAKTYLRNLSQAQDVFGYLNDVSTAETMVSRVIFQEPDMSDIMMWGGGLVLGWHQHRSDDAWGDAQRLWRQLEDTKPFWD